MLDYLRIEQGHVGQEVEDKWSIYDAENLVDESRGPAAPGASVFVLVLSFSLESVILNLKVGRFALKLVLLWKRGCVEVIDLANRSKGNESNQNLDLVSERTEEDDAENFTSNSS